MSLHFHSVIFACLFIFFWALTSCTASNEPLFKVLEPAETGITFSNVVTETDEQNMLTFEYIYNGAGVAAADFDGDGLMDLYFVGNEVQNELYLNRGDFRFENITKSSGTEGSLDKWYSGVAIVDINNDGLPDIYLSVTGRDDANLRRNELYINLGRDDSGTLRFAEMAEKYGLDHDSYTTQTIFFDYNNDGILDAYLLVANSNSATSYVSASHALEPDVGSNTDRLLRGVWSDDAGHIVYQDVSEEAGINRGGYGLSANILDINGNGFKDIYVANDYISEDLFWINNKDGTFTDMLPALFKHTSYSAMGSDVADINNDGLLDIFTLDMLPEINARAKMMANPNNYRNYVNNAFSSSFPQVTRNTLQLNLGNFQPGELPLFSEIAAFSGIEATDWSWAALFADFTNSGYKDLFVTNGIPRDITDKDFWQEYGRVRNIMPKRMALPRIPEVYIPNYIFENQGDLTFLNRTTDWGHNIPSYSTGAIYVDLDGNGALDLVVNNINESAKIYRNLLLDNTEKDSRNWLKIKLQGTSGNLGGLGTVVDLFYENGTQHAYDHTVYRGYLSSTDPIIHMGLGQQKKVDSLRVSYHLYNDKFSKTYTSIDANSTLLVDLNEFSLDDYLPEKTDEPLFRELTDQLLMNNTDYAPFFNAYNDFAKEPLSLYMRSERGPASAVGDISGNGLSDIFIGPSINRPAYILYQQNDGTFKREKPETLQFKLPEYMLINDAELFDATGNGFADLYLAIGTRPGFSEYTNDRLYLNDGNGNFNFDENWLPQMPGNSMSVASHDINKDGRPDLFVGGGTGKQVYPASEGHFILINENGSSSKQLFVDKTQEFAPYLVTDTGIINDAVWVDMNNDGIVDLVTAGEWEPIRIHQFDGKMLVDKTSSYGLDTSTGLWNTLVVTDLNKDGVPDIIAGNWGTNNLFSASEKYPLRIYFGDLTEDGFYESIPATYSLTPEGERTEFPYHHREDFMRHIPGMMQTYPTHKLYGNATMGDILSNMNGEVTKKEIYSLESSFFLSQEDGTFIRRALPSAAQFGPVFGLYADKTNSPLIFLSGNVRGGDVYSGSYNALELVVFQYEKAYLAHEQVMLTFPEAGIHQNGYGRAVYKIENSIGTNRYAIIFDDGHVRFFEK